jgi:hypothetical protein
MLQTRFIMNEGIANRMTTAYRILLLVKRQILRHAVIQFGIVVVYLYTCLNPRKICVTKATSAVPTGVNMYGHAATSKAIRSRLKCGITTYLQELLDYHNSSHLNALNTSKCDSS